MLNEKAREVYEYIRDRSEDGIPPSVREICTELGIKSTSTVHKYIQLLVDEGLLEKTDKINRSVKLKTKGTKLVPLIGTVAAGVPITAIENITDYISWERQKSYSNPLFALKIRGDSMINAGMFEGDVIIVEQTCVAENGEIVVALLDREEATVKRFFKENGHFRLQPENDNMQPFIVDEVEILGKVVALIRYF